MAALVAATHFPEAHQKDDGRARRIVSRDSYNVFIAVYMMASGGHGTIYIGVTSHLPSRVAQHREGLIEGFTKKYNVKRLVWYEPHEGMSVAPGQARR